MDFESKNYEYFIIVLFSFDAGALKGEESQYHLARLVSHPRIRLLTCVDNQKAGRIFDEPLLNQYNFCCYKVDTFREFDREKEFMSSLFVEKNENAELGLQFLFKSLTNNQKQIIQLIARH